MKRLFIVLMIYMFLIGCSYVNAAALPASNAPAALPDAAQESLAPLTYGTMEEYKDYIARFTDQSEFFTYEIIAQLGDFSFHSFTHRSGTIGETGNINEKCVDYSYDLITAGGQILTFSIYPGKVTEPSEVPIPSDFSDPYDLRTNTGVTGWRSIQDILYYYDNGVLKTVCLPMGNNTIQLTMPNGFSDYPFSVDKALPNTDTISNFLSEGDALIGRYTFNEYLSAAPKRAPGFDTWKAQHEIVLNRYEQFCRQNSSLKDLRLTPFAESLFYYILNPEWYDGLNADVNWEDFLSFEVGITTAEALHQQVGAPHMTCANSMSSIMTEVYLTADGYCIVYDVGLGDPIIHASIQHVDWQESREYEAFRLEMLEQTPKEAPAKITPQIIRWFVLGAVVITCSAVAVILLLKRRNLK